MADEQATGPTETDQAAILAGPTPPDVVAWRNEDPARRMYPSSPGFADVVPASMFEGADLPTPVRESAVKELRGMLEDTGLSPAEARQLLNRPSHVRAEGRSDEQQRKAARLELSRVFNDPDQALTDVKKLVSRDPRLAKFLTAKGIGNDPETIVTLARAARSQRAAGRLK